MKANTALCFLLLGLALYLQEDENRSRSRIARPLIILALLIASVTLIEIAFSLDLGIDQLLFSDTPDSIATSAPGRMSAPTAVAFVLTGLVMLFHTIEDRARQLIILLAIGIALSAFVSYPLNLVFGSSLFSVTGMALHTSTLFLILCSALLIERPASGWLQILFSVSPLGDNTRSLLATAILAPFLLGWLIFYGESVGWYEAGLARSTYSVAVMLLLAIVVIYNAQRLYEAESTQKLLQTDLRAVQVQLQAFLEFSPSALFVKDVSGRYQLVNSQFEKLVDKSSQEIVGAVAQNLFKGPVLDAVLGSDQTVIETKNIVLTEVTLPFGGEQRTYLNTNFPLLDPQGAVEYIGGIWTDITEQKALNDALNLKNVELERSNKELEQFAYVASHDLQEPLRMVSSYMQLLEGRYREKLDQDAKEFIDYAVDGANRMQRLIQDLLSFSRVGTRGKPPQPIDSSIALQEALQNLKMAIDESNAEVKADDLPIVMADKNQLVQVFQNLIANALKFRGEKSPQILVSVKESNGFAGFAVKDNGIGIDPKHSDRIFVIFQRLNPREQYEGTGIGLSVCKKIVERHGGRIWLESKPGKGSTFYFTFPLAREEQVPSEHVVEKSDKINQESIQERAERLI